MWDWGKSSQFQPYSHMHTWSKQGFCALGAGKRPLLLGKLHIYSEKELNRKRSALDFCTLPEVSHCAGPAVQPRWLSPHTGQLWGWMDSPAFQPWLRDTANTGYRAGNNDQPVQFYTASLSTSGICFHPTEILMQTYSKAEDGLKARAKEKWTLLLLTLNTSIHSED